MFPAGTEKSGNRRGRKRLGSCSLGVRASPSPLPRARSMTRLGRESMQVAEEGDVRRANDASRKAVPDALGRRQSGGEGELAREGRSSNPRASGRRGPSWPPAAPAVGSGASNCPWTRPRSRAVPSYGGTSSTAGRADSAVTEHGFTAQRNCNGAAHSTACGMGRACVGSPLGAISESFFLYSSL